ncbi:phospholipase D-like domain-containing protein [Paenibacillus filicis]|uniref:phospholipase D n=1 Tax=Paenibacillus gyeongsangnamensis TaxID=3388067 RepID=A0ABT4QJ73_9BACL|nr:phospholipase D-like domain-containing protein [Paenibacillus filicis]MCZ8516915.1 phospholipase D-like domain-containing protein [Paenibacillus filicis]
MKKATAFVLVAALSLTLSACEFNKGNPEAAAPAKTAVNIVPVAAEAQAAPQQAQQPAADSSKQQAAQQTAQQTTEAAKPQIDYAFTRDHQHPEKLLIHVINGAKSNLDIAIYSLTNKDIVDAILEAKKRGVEVRLITDNQEAKTAAQAAKLKQLKTAGIAIKENSHKGLMHLKVTIADKSTLTTGSFNYSISAATTNDEVLVVIHDSKIAQEWSTEFEKIWNDKVNYQALK